MNKKLQINEESIKNELNSYKEKPYAAISEYIWNSFDANATKVNISFSFNNDSFGYVKSLIIEDNGEGWDFTKSDTEIFLASDKCADKFAKKSLPKGKLGRGRYVFIWFCDHLKVESEGKILTLQKDIKYTIEDSKEKTKIGTRVEFFGIGENFSKALQDIDNLINEINIEFCWFLKENPEFKITINNKIIDYKDNVKLEKTYKKMTLV